MKQPEAVLSSSAGLHRAVWDLRWEGARRLEKAKVDLGDPTVGPFANPGTYRLRLTAGGQTEETVLNVVRDPRSRVSDADLSAQLAFALDLRGQIDRVVADVDEVRAIQAQADDLATRLAGNARASGLVATAKRVAAAAAAVEARLHNPKAEIVYDILAQRGGTQLHSVCSSTAAAAAAGAATATVAAAADTPNFSSMSLMSCESSRTVMLAMASRISCLEIAMFRSPGFVSVMCWEGSGGP